MKKLGFALICLLLLASVSYAQIPGGARIAAMGSAGAALVNDISAAYYNPAGLMASNTMAMKIKIGVGAAVTGMNQVIATFSKINDLNSFMADNLNNAIDVNGTTGALIGIEVAKVGLSIMPDGSLGASKTAGTVNGTASGNLNYDVALTLGTSMNLPALPMGFLDLGANIKYVSRNVSTTTISGVGVGAGTAAYAQTTGTGYGLDLGLRTGIEAPFAPVAVAVVAKDVIETINNETTTRTDTVNPDGSYTKGAEAKSTSSAAVATTWVFGAATQIPGVGTTIAADYASTIGNSELRLGVEQNLIPFFLDGRIGIISGANTSKTTLGVGLNMLGNMNIAYLIDNRNSKGNVAIVDFSLGL